MSKTQKLAEALGTEDTTFAAEFAHQVQREFGYSLPFKFIADAITQVRESGEPVTVQTVVTECQGHQLAEALGTEDTAFFAHQVQREFGYSLPFKFVADAITQVRERGEPVTVQTVVTECQSHPLYRKKQEQKSKELLRRRRMAEKARRLRSGEVMPWELQETKWKDLWP